MWLVGSRWYVVCGDSYVVGRISYVVESEKIE